MPAWSVWTVLTDLTSSLRNIFLTQTTSIFSNEMIFTKLLLSLHCGHVLAMCDQGPLSSTTPHFWSMVWEQNCQAIIMLNRVIEKSAIKCDQYWPLEPGQVMSWEPVGLSVENVAQTPGQHYTISTLR